MTIRCLAVFLVVLTVAQSVTATRPAPAKNVGAGLDDQKNFVAFAGIGGAAGVGGVGGVGAGLGGVAGGVGGVAGVLPVGGVGGELVA